MELILLERVQKLGQMGDVVSVKNGYARNFLLPRGKALRSSKANLAIFEARRAELEATNLELKGEAENVAAKLDDRVFIVIRSASDTGSLYGSVTTRDIADAASEDAVTVNRQQIELERPIKELGIHQVSVTLHPEVVVSIGVNVARSMDEAELQAQGKNVLDLDADEDDAAAAPEAAESAENAELVSGDSETEQAAGGEVTEPASENRESAQASDAAAAKRASPVA